MSNELVKQDSLTLWEVERELVEAYRNLEELRESGASSDDISKALMIVQAYVLGSRSKRDAVGNFMRLHEDYQRNIDNALERLQLKKDKAAKHYEQMCKDVLNTMEANQLTEIQGEMWTFKAKNNPPSVEVFDELAVSPEYLIYPDPPPPRVDKKKAAEDLKKKKEVPGCRLVPKKRLEIS